MAGLGTTSFSARRPGAKYEQCVTTQVSDLQNYVNGAGNELPYRYWTSPTCYCEVLARTPSRLADVDAAVKPPPMLPGLAPHSSGERVNTFSS